MKHTILGALAAGALMVGGIAATSQSALADGGVKYRVTITNATGGPNAYTRPVETLVDFRGQPLAPGLFITHRKSFSLFQINDEASDGLATMAETGDPADLKGEVDWVDGVKSKILLGPNGGLTLPGRSSVNDITTSRSAKYFTAVAMLGMTNDAFYAVRGIRLPKEGKITVHAVAYDAGSELNTEAESDIPGPGGNAHVDPGEGAIHVHRGIHGGAFLVPTERDWRNPVVEITVERLRGHGDDD